MSQLGELDIANNALEQFGLVPLARSQIIVARAPDRHNCIAVWMEAPDGFLVNDALLIVPPLDRLESILLAARLDLASGHEPKIWGGARFGLTNR